MQLKPQLIDSDHKITGIISHIDGSLKDLMRQGEKHISEYGLNE